MTVLIVDDSAMMRGIIKQVLQSHQTGAALEIREADNGEAAWDIVQQGGTDLVVLDMNMPVLDGLEFVRRVRARGLTIPLIMVSAVTDEEKIYEAGVAGVTAYLEKPIRGSELWETVREYLQ